MTLRLRLRILNRQARTGVLSRLTATEIREMFGRNERRKAKTHP